MAPAKKKEDGKKKKPGKKTQGTQVDKEDIRTILRFKLPRRYVASTSTAPPLPGQHTQTPKGWPRTLLAQDEIRVLVSAPPAFLSASVPRPDPVYKVLEKTLGKKAAKQKERRERVKAQKMAIKKEESARHCAEIVSRFYAERAKAKPEEGEYIPEPVPGTSQEEPMEYLPTLVAGLEMPEEMMERPPTPGSGYYQEEEEEFIPMPSTSRGFTCEEVWERPPTPGAHWSDSDDDL